MFPQNPLSEPTLVQLNAFRKLTFHFSNINFFKINFSNINFSNINLSNINFSNISII
jgi:uncharacterized protein YjbI with pentapeptide repeats